MNCPDEYDDYTQSPQHQGETLAAITSFQARKCAAIIQAYRDGLDLWAEHVATVEKFLYAAAFEGEGIGWAIRPGYEALWHDLEKLPWPPPGGPKSQLDLP